MPKWGNFSHFNVPVLLSRKTFVHVSTASYLVEIQISAYQRFYKQQLDAIKTLLTCCTMGFSVRVWKFWHWLVPLTFGYKLRCFTNKDLDIELKATTLLIKHLRVLYVILGGFGLSLDIDPIQIKQNLAPFLDIESNWIPSIWLNCLGKTNGS